MSEARWTQDLQEAGEVLDWVGANLPAVEEAAAQVVGTLHAGGRVLACGNGGSALQAQHLVAELVGRFRRERPPLAALALSADTGVLTAIANDYGVEEVFARQLRALGRPGDLLLAFSTSGNSPNVLRAVATAREIGLRTVAFCGAGGRLAASTDYALAIPSRDTARIQEGHLLLIHLLCERVEAELGLA